MSKPQLNDLEFRTSDIGRNRSKSSVLLIGQTWLGLRQEWVSVGLWDPSLSESWKIPSLGQQVQFQWPSEWFETVVKLKCSVLSWAGKAEAVPKGRSYQVQITWILLLESRRMMLSSPFPLQCDILSPSSTQSNEIEMSPGKDCQI